VVSVQVILNNKAELYACISVVLQDIRNDKAEIFASQERYTVSICRCILIHLKTVALYTLSVNHTCSKTPSIFWSSGHKLTRHVYSRNMLAL
jgi:hypothetical protein